MRSGLVVRSCRQRLLWIEEEQNIYRQKYLRLVSQTAIKALATKAQSYRHVGEGVLVVLESVQSES